ncbi:MAG: hypothetical protein AVO35_02060 [Candidatus Aegiribacteria sp. MLS_C]|nr:MAG: hypothetical protein AVO35_02060 [Candidatus Aegiribacteria sp. MLS_C]
MRYLALLVTLSVMVFASDYQGAMLNIMTPVSGLSEGSFEITVNHRFFGEAFEDSPLESFFGMDDGANVAFGIRYFPMDNAYLSYGNGISARSHSIELGWMESALEPAFFELNAGYYTFRTGSTANDDWEGGLTATVGLSALLAGDMIRPVVNYAYDGHQEEGGPGFGLEFYVMEDMSLWGEYFPAANDVAENDCFSFGSRYSTWGHQFLLALTNNPWIGPQTQIMGVNGDELAVGFQIRRMF